jgi:hypothetical protein
MLPINPPSCCQRHVQPLNSISGWQRVAKAQAKACPSSFSPRSLTSEAEGPINDLSLLPTCDIARASHELDRSVWSGKGLVVSAKATPREGSARCIQGQREDGMCLHRDFGRAGAWESEGGQSRDGQQGAAVVLNMRPATGSARGGGWLGPALRSSSRRLLPADEQLSNSNLALATLEPSTAPPQASASEKLGFRAPRCVSLQDSSVSSAQMSPPIRGRTSPRDSTCTAYSSDSPLSPEIGRLEARANAQLARGMCAPWSRSTVLDRHRKWDDYLDFLV